MIIFNILYMFSARIVSLGCLQGNMKDKVPHDLSFA